MSERSKSDLAEDLGLDRLLKDLVRDGWLMGMNAGVDPALVRMDSATGAANRSYFLALADRAIDDAQVGQRRAEDGPEPGAVAVLSVRVLGWSERDEPSRAELGRRVARVLREVLRVDDVIGRTAEDTFSLLLRGCPEDLHEAIAGRCRVSLERERIHTGGESHPVRVVVGTEAWCGQRAEELVDACAQRLLDA